MLGVVIVNCASKNKAGSLLLLAFLNNTFKKCFGMNLVFYTGFKQLKAGK